MLLCHSAQQEMNGPGMILRLCWCQNWLSAAAAVCHYKEALYLCSFVRPELGTAAGAPLVAFLLKHLHPDLPCPINKRRRVPAEKRWVFWIQPPPIRPHLLFYVPAKHLPLSSGKKQEAISLCMAKVEGQFCTKQLQQVYTCVNKKNTLSLH